MRGLGLCRHEETLDARMMNRPRCDDYFYSNVRRTAAYRRRHHMPEQRREAFCFSNNEWTSGRSIAAREDAAPLTRPESR